MMAAWAKFSQVLPRGCWAEQTSSTPPHTLHPASHPPSPGSQPRTQASNHSSPLLPGEMGGWMQIPVGHPVAFSADSSWEGPPRSGQRPDHHLDTQAWGSPTAIAAR